VINYDVFTLRYGPNEDRKHQHSTWYSTPVTSGFPRLLAKHNVTSDTER